MRFFLVIVASSLTLACFSRGAIHTYDGAEPGRPIADPGRGDAYVVWHDGTGWHLRARSEVGHVFEGRVESRRLRSVSPVGVSTDAVRAESGAIAFAFVPGARAGETGFDWQGGCTEFSLYVDGDSHPLRIFAGAYGANPPRIPFSLCP